MDIKKIFLKNQRLHNEVKALYQSQQENQMKNGKFAQYNWSSFLLELSGIPRQDDEIAFDLVYKVAVAIIIYNFVVIQIDMAQTVSDKETASIIFSRQT